MLQQKKGSCGNPKYQLDYRESKGTGKRVVKNKQIKSKIFKNLTEFPIQLNPDAKDNHSVSQANRPHSSLVSFQPNPRRNIRIESAMSHYPEADRKKFSLDSISKKNERDSLLSRNSVSKKMSKNNKSIEEGVRAKLGEDRRKYNLSCCSAIDERMKGESKKKKISIKHKRLSINNLHAVKRPKEGKENVRQPKDTKNVVGRDMKENIMEKQKSKSKNKRRKSTAMLDKSKTSTSMIGLTGQSLFKKKQSVSTVAIVVPIKKPKQVKKKVGKKKTEKEPKQARMDQFQHQQYPINKYDVDVTTKKQLYPVIGYKQRSKSKSRKASNSKDPKVSLIDYNSCINIPSNSSGLIMSRQSQNSPSHTENIKILDNWQFGSFAQPNNQASVNLQEIRYYQSFSCSKKKQEREFIERKFKDKQLYCQRRAIEAEILEDYPHFTELELKFLASVVFIQRKWRCFKLYRRIFNDYMPSPQLFALNLEKTNSKQLNISQGQRSPEKSAEQERKSNLMKDVAFIQSALTSTQAQTSPGESVPLKEIDKSQEKSVSELKQIQEESAEKDKSWKKVIEEEFRDKRKSNDSNRCKFFEDSEMEQPSSRNQPDLSSRSDRYSFLEVQIFPSMTYLLFRKEQLKQTLQQKVNELTALNKADNLPYDDYLRLRQRYEKQYEGDLMELGKSKHDIKKGYLKFIDTYKCLKHEALRRVSSETGPMAAMYHRLFQFDQTLSTPSDSSDSLKRLKHRVLIRKEFFQTHKIQSSRQPMHASPFADINFSDRNGLYSSRETQMQTHNFRSKKQKIGDSKVQGFRKKEIFLDLDEERLDLKRIRGQYGHSPQIEKIEIYSPQQIDPSNRILPISLKTDSKSLHTKVYDYQEQLIFEELIATLTHELFLEMLHIDQKRDRLMDIVKYDMEHMKVVRVEQSSPMGSPLLNHSQQGEVVEQQRLRQIYKIEGLQQRNKESELNRKHRNSNTYNISPASSEKIAFEFDDILLYIQELFAFLTRGHFTAQIVAKLNKNQGFTPIEYLRFLRDLQIPDDEYQPLLSNEMFVEWEDDFYSKHYPQLPHDEASFLHRQTITIFHRCIFETLISFLEQHRPCGEKGLPFPWEHVVNFCRPVEEGDMGGILAVCEGKVMRALKMNCGIIEEKYMLFCEEDMERIHEDNEDRIITMLEGELEGSSHNWYELEEHCLELRLEVEMEIFEYLMLEALDEMLEEA